MKTCAIRVASSLILLLSSLLYAADMTKIGESVYLLYHQDESGGMSMRCTATQFEPGKFITAAHCVTQDVPGTPGKLEILRAPVYLSDDRSGGEKQFTKVTIVTVGKPDDGYDFAILAAEKTGATTPLGDERKEHNGTEIVNIAAPAGLGKVYFTGHVALISVDRPLYDETSHVNWQNFMLLQLPAAGGSSGSAVVSRESGKIIGLVIGGTHGMTLALPISRVLNPDKKCLMREDGRDITPFGVSLPPQSAPTTQGTTRPVIGLPRAF